MSLNAFKQIVITKFFVDYILRLNMSFKLSLDISE